jgi:hypothetical protein
MAAGRYSFVVEQGSTFNIELQYKDSNGNPVNLTGYSGKMQIRSNYADNNPTTYVTLSSSLNPDGTGLNFAGSSGINPPTSGTIGVIISAATSSALTFATAKYDLELTSGSIVTRLIEGDVQLSKEVTR